MKAVILLLPLLCLAQQPTESDRADLQQQYSQVDRLFRSQEITRAVGILEKLRQDPRLSEFDEIRINTLYNLSCGYSRLGRKEDAVASLRDAVAAGYNDYRRIQQDTDFENIRHEGGYLKIIAGLKSQERFWESPAWKTPYLEHLSDEQKVAGLSRFWSEVRYNFAWFEHLPDLDWDKAYLEYIPKVLKTANTFEYYQVLRQMCALLRDSHTNVNFPAKLEEQAFASPALRTRLVEGKVLILDVLDPKLRNQGIQPGLEIAAVDGMPVRQYAAERVIPYQSAATPQDLEVRAYEYGLLSGAKSQPVHLLLRNAAGAPTEYTVARLFGEERAAFQPKWQRFESRMLSGNIAYVALNTFGDQKIMQDFDAAFDSLRDSAALILDVRNNGGGSSGFGWHILSYLTDKPILASQWRTRDYRPSMRAWGYPDRWFSGPPSSVPPHGSKLYAKPVVVLIGPRTFSAAEDFAVVFADMKRGKIIGEPSGGSTGQPLSFNLPGGGSARVCTKQDRYPGGRDFVGVGVQPDVLVRPTIEDVRTGRDAVLEAAVASLRNP